MAKKEEYGVEAIRVLKGLEPVKQRPGMYTLTDNPLHIIQEVIDNASDEVLAGYGKRISVEVAADGSVTVEDDGRGIPTICQLQGRVSQKAGGLIALEPPCFLF